MTDGPVTAVNDDPVTVLGAQKGRHGGFFAEIVAEIVASDPEWFCARWGGTRSCENRPSDPHCSKCHLPLHVCHECGGEIDRYGSSAVTTRSDRIYCSNRCRQSAYRKRVQTERTT